MSAMTHLICCGTAGNRRNGSDAKTVQEPLNCSTPIPLINTQPLQPSEMRTPERLHKPRPRQTPSPHPPRRIFNPFKSISPSKLNILPSLRKSSSRLNGVAPETEALYQEGREMLRMEREANGAVDAENTSTLRRPERALIRDPGFYVLDEDNTDMHGVQNQRARANEPVDWITVLNLGSPSSNEESPRRLSSDYPAEITIPIRRSSKGDPIPAAVSKAYQNLTAKSKHNIYRHDRMSSQFTQLRPELAPHLQLSQLVLEQLDTEAIIAPEQTVLRPYGPATFGSNVASVGFNGSLRRASSTISAHPRFTVPNNTYVDHHSDIGHNLKYSHSDYLRGPQASRPPIPVPTTERNLFKRQRDKGLVSLDAYANGSSVFTTDADMEEVETIKVIPTPPKGPTFVGTQGLERVNQSLENWNDKLHQNDLGSYFKGPEENGALQDTNTNPGLTDYADNSSSVYPSQPPSRHDSTFKELLSIYQAPPMPEIDSRVTDHPVIKKHPPVRSRSVGAASNRSGSSAKESTLRRNLSKIKKGLSGKKVRESDDPPPPPIPARSPSRAAPPIPPQSPMRNAASLTTLGTRNRPKAVNTISGHTATTVESYQTAPESIKRAHSVSSYVPQDTISTGDNLRRAISPLTQHQHTRSPTGEWSHYSDQEIFSPAQSPEPGASAGRQGNHSWVDGYRGLVEAPFGSSASIHNRLSAYGYPNIDSVGNSNGTTSPIETAHQPVSMIDGAADEGSTSMPDDTNNNTHDPTFKGKA